MVVVPIVEGHGDAAAVPVLLRRLVDAAQAWDAVRIGQPIRCKRSQLVDQAELISSFGRLLDGLGARRSAWPPHAWEEIA